MSSAAKALELLSYFTPKRPQIGLSHMCKLARRDKATTYRHLRVLENAGFLEQDLITKQFRLGPVVLQLANTREISFPRKKAVQKPLSTLAEACGETCHVSVLSGETVYGLSDCESTAHSTRAIVDVQTFPLHATASGLCALAFGPDKLMDVAAGKLEAFTSSTIQTSQNLMEVVQDIRNAGFARSNRCFEEDVYGIAAPVFCDTGQFAGAVAVASVASRFEPDLEQKILNNLILASREISHAWGGSVPRSIENAWSNSMSNTRQTEPAS